MSSDKSASGSKTEKVLISSEIEGGGLFTSRLAALTLTRILIYEEGFHGDAELVQTIHINEITEVEYSSDSPYCLELKLGRQGESLHFSGSEKYAAEIWSYAVKDCMRGEPESRKTYEGLMADTPQAAIARLKKVTDENREALQFAKGVAENFARGKRYSAFGVASAVKKTYFQQKIVPEVKEITGIAAAEKKVAEIKQDVTDEVEDFKAEVAQERDDAINDFHETVEDVFVPAGVRDKAEKAKHTVDNVKEAKRLLNKAKRNPLGALIELHDDLKAKE